MNTKRLVYCALLAAAAFALSAIDALIPMPVPGLKLGLANIISLYAAYKLKPREAALILIVRCILGGLLFGGLTQIIFSLGAGFAALIVMLLFKNSKNVSCIGTGIAGAAMHNTVQVAISAILLSTPALFTYLCLMLPASIITGTLTAIAYMGLERQLGKLV